MRWGWIHVGTALGALLALPAVARAAPDAWVSPLSRAHELGLLLWLLLLVLVLCVLLRRGGRRDALLVAALALGGALAALPLAPVPANYYLPVSAQAFAGVEFSSSHPVTGDGLLRLVAWLGGGESLFFVFQLLLGAMVGPLLYLAARCLGRRRGWAFAWAALSASTPLLLHLARSDAPHVMVFALAAAALLGMASRVPLLSAALGLVSLLLALAVRLELVPGLCALALLVVAVAPATTRSRSRAFWLVGLALVSGALAYAASLWAPAYQLAQEMGRDASLAAGLGGLLAGRLPGSSELFWMALVLPLVGLAWISLSRRGRRLNLGALLAGLLLAAAPVLAAGVGHTDLVRGRYLVLAIPFVSLLMTFGLERAGELLPGRLPLEASARLPVLALAVALLSASAIAFAPRAREAWQHEYRFLREALVALPSGCVIVHEEGGAASGPSPALVLRLPHPLLVLQRPDLRWWDAGRGAPPESEACLVRYQRPAGGQGPGLLVRLN